MSGEEQFELAQERCPYRLSRRDRLPDGLKLLPGEYRLADVSDWDGHPDSVVLTNQRLLHDRTSCWISLRLEQLTHVEWSATSVGGALVLVFADGSRYPGPLLTDRHGERFARRLEELARAAAAPLIAPSATPALNLDTGALAANPAYVPQDYTELDEWLADGRRVV